jgi:predicted DCC family thiol-disulfide oxidoreductase YuxK
MPADLEAPPEARDAAPTADPPGALTVYFDGSCPLCAAEIGVYRKDAGETVRFCDVSAPGGAPPDLEPEAAMARFHVRRADGRMENGARAFIALWLALPRWRWLGRIASAPPLPHLLEAAYRLFLPLRPMLQRLARRRNRTY